MNHLAIVKRARGGPELKLGDNKQMEKMMADSIKTRTVMVDGLPFELSDIAAAAVDKLTAARDAAIVKLGEKTTEFDRTIAARDAEIEKLKGKMLSDADMEKRVAARASLLSSAKALVPSVVVDGKSDDDIRRFVVQAKFGDAAVTDKSADYVAARFDFLVEDLAKKNPVRDGLMQKGAEQNVLGVNAADGDPVQAAYLKGLQQMADAWKTPSVKE
jgi:hypothetical protein